MVELQGEENVRSFIGASKKKKFKIYGINDANNKAPRWQSNGDSIEEDFTQWAKMVDNGGLNVTEYRIRCYDKNDGEGAGGDVTTGIVTATFCLNAPLPKPATVAGAALTPGTAITAETIAAAIKASMPQQAPQVDIAAIVSGAVKDVAHKYQLEALTTSNAQVIQSLTMQLADMREELQEYMEEEEEAREDSETAKAIEKQMLVEKEKWGLIEKHIPEAIGLVREVVYNFVPGMAKASLNKPGANIAVNGPTLTQTTAAKGWVIPVSDKIGELPAATKPEEVNMEDQKAKAQAVNEYLLAEVNDVHGDDMMLLKKMAIDMPERFSSMIFELRKIMK